jgi:demethylmenaquinone methyltransferase / 2-methoxy-6-polyprenyl-1,4-benzoquinol methylase
MIHKDDSQEDDSLKNQPPPHQDSFGYPKEPKGETTFFGFRKVPVREKAGYVLKHFNSIANKYDLMNTILSFGLHYVWKRRSVNALGLKEGALVIDVCGGTADLSILAAREIGPQGRVILCDINRAMMEWGKPKVARASLEGRILFVQGDAESLSFPQSSFDAAMVGFGIRNLTNMERGIAEMYRVLKPGGRMMCLEFSLPTSQWFRALYDFYSFQLMPLAGKIMAGNRAAYLYLPESIRRFPPPDSFAALLRDAGFSSVAYQRLTNGIAMIYTGVKD